jgi:hypothetical protein
LRRFIMDARVKPGHDAEYAARSSLSFVIAGLDPAIHDAFRQ